MKENQKKKLKELFETQQKLDKELFLMELKNELSDYKEKKLDLELSIYRTKAYINLINGVKI